jgi:hypothetical protein
MSSGSSALSADEQRSVVVGATSVLLSRVDDTDYRAVRAVYAVKGDDPPFLYCAESDWPQTPMAQIAALQRKVAELESALKQQASERTIAPPARRAGGWEAGGADKRVMCDRCGKRIWPDLLERHVAEKHPPAPDHPIALTDDQGWRCAARGCDGAHARDLHDPQFCTKHAAPRTNGAQIEVTR